MKNWVKAILYPIPLFPVLRLPRYFEEWNSYSRLSTSEPVLFRNSYPCLSDKTSKTPFDAHYFYQGAWLARKLAEVNSELHIDVGSSVMTIGALSAVTKTIFVDYRPLQTDLVNLMPMAADICCLPLRTGSIDSLSCLHVIEHIGLGRYGDRIDPKGSEKAAKELQRILKPGGRLYLSTPVGRERVCFNAHRVFSPKTIITFFPDLELCEFNFVDDDGNFNVQTGVDTASKLDYGCGMYALEKPRDLPFN